MRRLGDITADLEELLDEMIDDHDMQWGEIRSLVMNQLKVHRPDAQEEYEDGSHPVDYYGPKDE